MNIQPTTMTFGNREWEVAVLNLVFTDNTLMRTVTCQIFPLPTINGRTISRPMPTMRLKPLTLWSNEEYDAIGDWTQAQAESRVLELLGSDIKTGLEQQSMYRTR